MFQSQDTFNSNFYPVNIYNDKVKTDMQTDDLADILGKEKANHTQQQVAMALSVYTNNTRLC